MSKGQKRMLYSILCDVTPKKPAGGSKENEQFIRGVEKQLLKVRKERLEQAAEDRQIAKQQRRIERAEQYEALVAEEKQHTAVLQKKIFQFMANLSEQASCGKFEEARLEDPV